MKEYLNSLNKKVEHDVIYSMREYAKTNKVPIINDEGLGFINQLVRLLKPNAILEIGTAIGYSAINMALSYEGAFIDTIERNPHLAKIAQKNIDNCNLSERIHIYEADALDIDLNVLKAKYDLIFIDAAKSQYIKFFEKFEVLLGDNGIIISDNILFHGLVTAKEKIESKNLRHLVQKIKDYNKYLAKHKKYLTTFYNLGDGMAISEKVKR